MKAEFVTDLDWYDGPTQAKIKTTDGSVGWATWADSVDKEYPGTDGVVKMFDWRVFIVVLMTEKRFQDVYFNKLSQREAFKYPEKGFSLYLWTMEPGEDHSWITELVPITFEEAEEKDYFPNRRHRYNALDRRVGEKWNANKRRFIKVNNKKGRHKNIRKDKNKLPYISRWLTTRKFKPIKDQKYG